MNSCVVVLSAMQETTDELIKIGKLAESGGESFREKITAIKEKHLETAKLLIVNEADDLLDTIENYINELKSICEGVFFCLVN